MKTDGGNTEDGRSANGLPSFNFPSRRTTVEERVLSWRVCIDVVFTIVTTWPHDDDSNSCGIHGNELRYLDESLSLFVVENKCMAPFYHTS